jgi:CHAT domain/Ternary complex associated domain 7
MQRIRRESGLQITLPDNFEVLSSDARPAASPSTRRGSLGGARGAIPMPPAAVADPMVAAFERQEMQLLDQVELTPGAAGPATRAITARSGLAEFSLPLVANENAALLLEQDGMYSWQLPEESAADSAAMSRMARRGTAGSQAMFRITLSPAANPAASGAPAVRRGFLTDFVSDKIKAYVFKFAARAGVNGLVKFLERNARAGIVNLVGGDAGKWEFIDGLTQLALPDDRPARILLFIHGTFSSTVGGFGALTATPWGSKFLEGARANYDAVIGFDHPTLSVDPLSNATELLKRMEGRAWKFAPQIDIITHSRGGLVTRSLVEQLLPMSALKPLIGRVIFVAATNGGTELAAPQNWKTLIDLYTNLAFGASKLLQLLPQAHLAGLILNETVQSLGALVKFAATHALTDEGAPGLAAMRPDGPFVKQINETQPGQLNAMQSFYFAVTSQFIARLTGEHQPSELPARLLQLLGAGLMRELMRESNDLVVNTASMTTIDPHAGKFIKDSLDFTASPQVYHTNYFLQPKVADALTRWLGLIEPAPVASTGRPASRRSARAFRGANEPASDDVAPGSLAAAAAARRVTLAGETPEVNIPAIVDTDILVVDADDSAAELRRKIEARVVSFVVVRRVHEGKLLNYAFKYEEALQAISPNDKRTTLDALNLHEYDKSETRTASDEMTPPVFTGGSSTSRRLVITANGQPVGVLPESVEPLTAAQIAELAQKTANPKTIEDRADAKRAMPTFVQFAGMEKAEEEETPPRVTRGPRRSIHSLEPTNPSSAQLRPTAKPVLPKETCYFHAEMEEEVIVNQVTTIEALISREIIERATGPAAIGGNAQIEAARKIIVQAIPKRNFENVDDGRAEVDPPPPGQPHYLYFDLKPTDVGDGEVWIVARQGQISLVTLKLKAKIVQTKEDKNTAARASSIEAVTPAPSLKAALHQLRIFKISHGDQSSFRYDLESPELGLFEKHESKPFTNDLGQYVADLYKKIEDRWLSSKQDFDDFNEELRAFGAELFDELIPEKLQQRLWDNRDRIRSIQVISDEPFIPWELVHLKEPSQPLSAETRFLGQMGLVRWLHEAGFWPPDKLLVRRDRARYIVPDYPDPRLTLSAAKEEARFLAEKLGASATTPKSSEVRKLISQPGAFDLLHFACHGAADTNNIAEAQLLMEGRIENGLYVFDSLTATIAEQFANMKGPDNRPMIVLNACQAGRAGYKLTGLGGFAQAFLKRGAGVFIGALWSVGDNPARSFTEEFYTQLLNRATIAEATIKAREQARQAREATWLAYVVYGHPHLEIV